MLNKCNNCHWYYSHSCCSESLDTLDNDITYETELCVGFLRKDFEIHMIDMKSKLLVFCKEQKIINHVKNMSYRETLETYARVFG